MTSNGRRLTERKALLFDGMLILCKPSYNKRVNITVAVAADEHPTDQEKLRLKEKFFIEEVDIIDIEDTEGELAFTIFYRNFALISVQCIICLHTQN